MSHNVDAEQIIQPCQECGKDELAWVMEFEFVGCCNCGSVYRIKEENKDWMFDIFFKADRISKGSSVPKVILKRRKKE